MLFMLEAFTPDNKSGYPMRYIYACATHPDYRKQGLMGKLLNAAVEYADEKRIDLALVPANAPLFDYYKRFGFTQTTYLYRRAYPPIAASKASAAWQKSAGSIDESVQMLQRVRSHLLKGKDAVLWPGNHLKTVLEELFSENGEFLVLKNNGRLPFGYALSLPRGEKIEIVECMSVFPQDDMIASLRNFYRDKATLFNLSSGIAGSCSETPFGLLYSSRPEKELYLNLALNF